MSPKLPPGLEMLSRYIGNSLQKNGKPDYRLPKLQLKAKPLKFKPPNIQNPLNNIAKSVSTTVSKLTGKEPGENYDEIVKGFVPRGAKLITPKYPSNTKGVHLADIDGDKQDELIASYKQGEDLRTIVLKKQNGRWEKTAQIDHPGYQDVNFRTLKDIAGEGRKHLLIGLSTEGKYADLYGYRMDKGNMNKLFVRRYHRIEILNSSKEQSPSNGPYMAIWNLKEDKAGAVRKASDSQPFNIDVVRWNGSDFEAAANPSSYFRKNVIPYYVQKVKTSPKSVSNWYNLADALVSSGAHRDALDAIEVGMRQDSRSEYTSDFTDLKNRLTF